MRNYILFPLYLDSFPSAIRSFIVYSLCTLEVGLILQFELRIRRVDLHVNTQLKNENKAL